MTHRSKWFLSGTAGFALTGLGLSMAIDAAFARAAGEPWVAYGTLSLVIFNAGLGLVGRSVAEFVWMRDSKK